KAAPAPTSGAGRVRVAIRSCPGRPIRSCSVYSRRTPCRLSMETLGGAKIHRCHRAVAERALLLRRAGDATAKSTTVAGLPLSLSWLGLLAPVLRPEDT